MTWGCIVMHRMSSARQLSRQTGKRVKTKGSLPSAAEGSASPGKCGAGASRGSSSGTSGPGKSVMDATKEGGTGKRGRFRASKVGIAAATTAVFIGGALLYREAHLFHQKFSTTTDVFEVEKSQKSYIYLLEEDDIIDIHRLGTPNQKSKLKWKWKSGVHWFPWLQSRSRDPHTLLRLAMSKDHSIRLLGVKALSEQHHWHDAQYMRVAQASDKRTIVGLARSQGVDLRFFLPPPKLPPTQASDVVKDVIEDEFRKLLSALPTTGIDKCTKYFTSSALQEGKAPLQEDRGGLWCFGGNGLAFAGSISAVPEERVEIFCLQAVARHARQGIWSIDGYGMMSVASIKTMPSDIYSEMFCLEALFSHSTVPSHCPQIVELGGLQLLQRICEHRSTSIKIQRNIARIVANMCLDDKLHDDIFRAGWVSILANWMKSPDLALSLHATRALANMDRDFGDRKYEDGVYLYHPQFRYSEPVYADIVFVHGLLGGPFRTWRQKDPEKPANKPGTTDVRNDDSSSGKEPYTFCWPKDWLAKDFPNVRILTVEYETHLSEWAPKCPFESEKRSVAVRSADILAKLRKAGIGDRPIVWVGHSMGGLLIKQMLVTASQDPALKRLVGRSRGIIFYSVPHQGSSLAALSNSAKYLLYPSVEVKELKQDSEMLKRLHGQFKSVMFKSGIPLLSFGEGQKTDVPLSVKVMIVPKESSDPGFGEYHLMEELNHLNICKPENRDCPVYQLSLDFIKDCVPQNLVDHILMANLPDEYVLPDMPS